jgi:hypothetical protein
MTTALNRLRLALDGHESDLLLVGDRFEEGGRYVQIEIPCHESQRWSRLDWGMAYDRLAAEWQAHFSDSPGDGASKPDVEPFAFANDTRPVFLQSCGTVCDADPANEGIENSTWEQIKAGGCDCENTGPWKRIYVERS